MHARRHARRCWQTQEATSREAGRRGGPRHPDQPALRVGCGVPARGAFESCVRGGAGGRPRVPLLDGGTGARGAGPSMRVPVGPDDGACAAAACCGIDGDAPLVQQGIEVVHAAPDVPTRARRGRRAPECACRGAGVASGTTGGPAERQRAHGVHRAMADRGPADHRVADPSCIAAADQLRRCARDGCACAARHGQRARPVHAPGADEPHPHGSGPVPSRPAEHGARAPRRDDP